MQLPLLLCLLFSIALADEESLGCTITAASCRNFPEFRRTQFRDHTGEEHQKTGSNDAACLKRAEDFHFWCGNSADEGAQVAATYNPEKLSQVHHPGACEKGWSQWDAFCFKHYWEKKTWWEAEKICRDLGAHLASVHSDAENRFIYTLTNGLSAWIGYTDIDRDTHYQWSDSTQDDFTNWAKNCTGREHEPDCKPEEKAKQWYDWDGNDAGTYVCKKNALLPLALLRNVTAKTLTKEKWEILLPALGAMAAQQSGLMNGQGGLPSPKAPDFVLGDVADHTDGKPPPPKPKLMAPTGSLM